MTIGDAGSVLAPAKILKTDDEIECIRRAQAINEAAMYDVYAALAPGVRAERPARASSCGGSSSSAHREQHRPDLAGDGRAIADGPFTVHGDVAFPTATRRDGILRRRRSGDRSTPESSTRVTRPTSAAPGSSDRRRRRDRSTSAHDGRTSSRRARVTRPGTTGLELNRAARAAETTRRPWLDHFYLIHGIGTDSAEMPLIGTDLGEEFDETIVLAPGMVMVLEPVIWDDGDGGYRVGGGGGGHGDRVPLPQPLPLHALRRGDGDVVRLGTMALYDGARVDFARLRRERRERCSTPCVSATSTC